MPSERLATQGISKVYKYNTMDNIMYGYVTAMLRSIPSMTISRAIEWFMYDFGLSEDEYPLETARVNHNRLKNAWQDIKIVDLENSPPC